jgi:hypothetical protein
MRRVLREGLGLIVVIGGLVLGAAAETKLIEVAVRQGTLPPGQRVLRVLQGDDVTLRWTTDAPIKLHLHGYDIETKLTPGQDAAMTFRATATGRFPITVHGTKHGHEATLGYLEVHPR